MADAPNTAQEVAGSICGRTTILLVLLRTVFIYVSSQKNTFQGYNSSNIDRVSSLGIASPRSRHVAEEPPFSHNPPHQSPIDILTRQAVRRHLPDLRFVHPLSDSTAITLKNNGKGGK